MIKGFTMDDERLKGSGGGNYWKELLERIRDIRSSEKVLYRQVLDLYATAKKISISLHSFEGNTPAGTLDGYLNDCITYAKAAAQAGKLCAFRLWNLDGETTQGANQENDHILQLLHDAFPGEWKTDWKGATLAPHIYLEWGEKFEWPDLTAPEHEGKAFCYGLRDHVGVLCDGTVVPCCLDHEGDIPLGNLFEQPLDEILASSRAQAIYNGFSNGSACEELCRKCGYSRRFTK